MHQALKISNQILIGLVFVFLCACKSSTAQIQTDTFKVAYVVDGDTLHVKNDHQELKVRLIGIDAPELHQNEKALRDSKRSGIDLKTITELGERSRQHLKQILKEGSEVKLRGDVGKFDRFGRTLAYVYSKDGSFVNLVMLEDGYAYPFSIPPNIRFEKDFREAAQQARNKKVGLWAK